jgi:PBP1b-binding outer membrane lipoprotein LpoB
MKILSSAVACAFLLSGCISSSSPPPPEKTTVVVPRDQGTVVVCQDGTKPPCS